jgi:hypothetical protein
MIPWRSELICWSANCRNLMNGFSGLGGDLFESFSESEDEAISHAVSEPRSCGLEVAQSRGVDSLDVDWRGAY